MTHTNDMPADTELREQLKAAISKGYSTKVGIINWTATIDRLLQLIKQRDAAIRQETMQDMAYNVNTVISDYQALGYQVDVIGIINGYVSDHTPTDQKEKAE